MTFIALFIAAEQMSDVHICARRAGKAQRPWRQRQQQPTAPEHAQHAAAVVLAPELPVDANFLVCFLASHTSTAARAGQLEATLQSAAAQVPHPPPLHISWSATSDAEACVRQVLARAEWPQLEQVQQLERHSQFEHLHALVRRVQSKPSAPPTWVYFTDDDDIWSDRRHAIYLAECYRAEPSTLAVVCTRKARPAVAGVHVEELAAVRDAAAVRIVIESGFARLTNLEVHDVRNESFHMVSPSSGAPRLHAFGCMHLPALRLLALACTCLHALACMHLPACPRLSWHAQPARAACIRKMHEACT